MATKKMIIKENVSFEITISELIGNKNNNTIGYSQIFQRLKNIPDMSEEYKFSYWVNKNLNKIISIYKSVEKDFLEKSKSIDHNRNREYNEKLIVIKQKYARKDENGEVIVNEGNIIIDDDKSFRDDINILDNEYKDLLDAINDLNNYALSRENEIIKFEPYILEKKHLQKGLTPLEIEKLECFLR